MNVVCYFPIIPLPTNGVCYVPIIPTLKATPDEKEDSGYIDHEPSGVNIATTPVVTTKVLDSDVSNRKEGFISAFARKGLQVLGLHSPPTVTIEDVPDDEIDSERFEVINPNPNNNSPGDGSTTPSRSVRETDALPIPNERNQDEEIKKSNALITPDDRDRNERTRDLSIRDRCEASRDVIDQFDCFSPISKTRHELCSGAPEYHTEARTCPVCAWSMTSMTSPDIASSIERDGDV